MGWTLLTLVEYILGVNLGIDTTLFPRATLAEANRYPGRMSWVTACNFVILTGAFLLLEVELPRRFRPAELLSVVVLLGGLIPAFGYLFYTRMLRRQFDVGADRTCIPRFSSSR